MQRQAVDPIPRGYNIWGKARALLNHEMKILETPNTETPYNVAVVDLQVGPVVVVHPAHRGRYFRTSVWDVHGDTRRIDVDRRVEITVHLRLSACVRPEDVGLEDLWPVADTPREAIDEPFPVDRRHGAIICQYRVLPEGRGRHNQGPICRTRIPAMIRSVSE